jgi:hypothetical protein
MVALQALPHAPRVASDGAAGLLASGSLYSRAFPRGQPPKEGDPPHAVAFSGFVPGYSGGGRAGITPASLSKTHDPPGYAGGSASPHRRFCQKEPATVAGSNENLVQSGVRNGGAGGGNRRQPAYWLGGALGAAAGAGTGIGTGTGVACGSAAGRPGTTPTKRAGMPCVWLVLTNCGMV